MTEKKEMGVPPGRIWLQWYGGGEVGERVEEEEVTWCENEIYCNDEEYLRKFPIQELIDKQAKDEGLWFQAKTAPEAYLQQELRKLHALIEDLI